MHIVHMGPGSAHELQSMIDLQPQGHGQSAGDRVWFAHCFAGYFDIPGFFFSGTRIDPNNEEY